MHIVPAALVVWPTNIPWAATRQQAACCQPCWGCAAPCGATFRRPWAWGRTAAAAAAFTAGCCCGDAAAFTAGCRGAATPHAQQLWVTAVAGPCCVAASGFRPAAAATQQRRPNKGTTARAPAGQALLGGCRQQQPCTCACTARALQRLCVKRCSHGPACGVAWPV